MTLREAAQSSGLTVGFGILPNLLETDAQYSRLIVDNAMTITPWGALTMRICQPKRGQFDWSRSKTALQFAHQNNLSMRGFTLAWYYVVPKWFEDLSTSDGQKELNKHINKVAGLHASSIQEWDAINEHWRFDGQGHDSALSRLGPDKEWYVRATLNRANLVAPNAKLFINENGAEIVSKKSDALYTFCKRRLAVGGSLAGIGLQMHRLDRPLNLSSFTDNVRRFIALGLEVQITEMTIGIKTPATITALQWQADEYSRIITAARKEGVKTFIFGQLCDKYSPIPTRNPGYGAAHLFDANYQPKPAYDAVLRAIS